MNGQVFPDTAKFTRTSVMCPGLMYEVLTGHV